MTLPEKSMAGVVQIPAALLSVSIMIIPTSNDCIYYRHTCCRNS